MKIKLFGRELFEMGKSSRGEMLLQSANQQNKESKYLPDFYTMVSNDDWGSSFIQLQEVSTDMVVSGGNIKGGNTGNPAPERVKYSPKEVYELKMIHEKAFVLNTDEKYVDDQIANFRDKLSILKSGENDMRRGLTEIGSILIRLENRKKYTEVRKFFEEYPYTTSSKIADVIKENDYLKLGLADQFVADMPKEAITTMKDYDNTTKELCGKKAIFYIIADKKDFQKTEKRRDPILLAQSPFGHFWQILGAWDKEMMLLEDL